MRVPALESHIIKFCSSISEGVVRRVSLEPVKGAPLNECFTIVPEYISEHGGEQVIGWAVWEWPKVMLEAEFHCVWRNPEGRLIDLTPKPKDFSEIVFLEDRKKKYTGKQVNNIRRALSDSLTIKKYIETANKIYTEMNKGSLADYHGELEPTPKLMKLYKKMASLQSTLAEKYGSPF